MRVDAKPGDAETAEARKRFEHGLAHFNLQEYPQAIDDFEAAYRLHPDAVFLYNLAQAYRLNNDNERALYFYRTYLRANPDAANRDEVENRIAALEKLQADKRDVARPPDTPIAPDDKPKPVTPQQTASTPAPPPPPATATLVATPPPRKQPVYKKWWLWTGVGVVAVGVGLGVGLGLGLHHTTPLYSPVTF